LNQEYTRREGENYLDYAMRLISIKKETRPNDLDWCDIVDYLGLDYNPDSLRKSQDSQFGGLAVYKEMQKRIANNCDDKLHKQLSVEINELQKIKQSISDERAALNRIIREQSRIDSIMELADKCVCSMPPLNIDEFHDVDRIIGCKSLIVSLSDFHYGLEINEFNNKYNKDIFHKRLEVLLSAVIKEITYDLSIKNVVVLGIGDFIAGLIHNVIRIESRENVIQQVIDVSEALIDFIVNIRKSISDVSYYDCIGNHSRLFEEKDNCLSKESFDLLIHYILEQRFSGTDVIINDYSVNEKISEFCLFGKKYAIVHGDGFNINTLAKDLSSMTKNFYEAIFIGHIHHVFVEEQNGTLVISNGTFAGNDEYANRINKTSVPSQNIFIVSENGIEDIKTIKLNIV